MSSGGFEPPDPQVAAGPGYVVELVNLAARFWRTGDGPAVELRTEPLATLFSSGNDKLTDPRIVYDAPTQRWFASISDLDAHSIRLAVSASPDPTGGWTLSSYPAPGCADQPRLGIADGTVVLGADIFQNCEAENSEPSGSELWIVNKAQLLAGSTSPASATYGPNDAYSSFAPVQSLSATAIEYVVSLDEPASRVVHVLAVTGVPPDPVAVKEVATPAVNRIGRPPFASQPASSAGSASPGIATNDDRVLDSVWQDGRLWFSANESCVPRGDTLIRACARIVELATPALTVTGDTDLGAAGANIFYPALRPDASGDLVIVYGESGTTIPVETVAVARTADGTFTGPVVIAQSVGPYLGARYGDYFGAATDPGDPTVVWVAGESGTDTRGGHGWSSDVASVAVTPAGGTVPKVLVAPPPTVRTLPVSAKHGTAVALRYRFLADALGVRTALTVRSAEKRTLFATTTTRGAVHAGQLYSVRWRPARTLRGAFSYCAQTIASDGVASAASCTRVRLR